MNPNLYPIVLTGAVHALPFVVIWVVGIVLSLKIRSKSPQIGNLALAAFTLFVFAAVVEICYGAAVSGWPFPTSFASQATYLTRLRLIYGLQFLFNLFAWCLLVLCFHRASHKIGSRAV